VHDELDPLTPLTPLFFLSYAHAGEGGRAPAAPRAWTRRVSKLFDDLSESVAALVSRPLGSYPGYMDRSIPDGGRWTKELLEAIGTCQVFVALLSPSYFNSHWCSMEWHAFSQRKVTRRSGGGGDHQTAIIPVIFAPFPHEPVPPAVGEIQWFSPNGLPNSDIAAQYEKDGVYGLLQMQLDSGYSGVVWRLAQRIAELHYSHLVEPCTFRQNELRDIFREQKP
jgi:TIR domain